MIWVLLVVLIWGCGPVYVSGDNNVIVVEKTVIKAIGDRTTVKNRLKLDKER